MKAVILARVSTKEQEEGHSIAAQKQRLHEYCERKELEVIRVFEIIESSTKGQRKDFMAMLDFVKKHTGTIAIVSDAVDRFQRSFKESVLIDELRQKGQVELHFYRENIIINHQSSPAQIMMWDYSVIGAKAYVANLSANVRRSMEYKRLNGEWGGNAPIGYLNARDERNKATLIPDPERAFLIKRLFQEFSTGCYSIGGDMTRMAREIGLRNKTYGNPYLVPSQMMKLLQNPFYCGEMVIKGERYEHQYDPIITRELFDKCQRVMASRTRTQTVKATEKPFVLRGLIRCSVSDRIVTCDLKKGKFTYLICRDPQNPEKKLYIPESQVLSQLQEVFKSFQIPEALLEALTNHLRASHDAERKFHEDALIALRRDYDTLQRRLDTLLDLLLDKSITKPEYDKKVREIKEQQLELDIRIKQHKQGDDSFRTTVSTLFSLASRAHAIFERSKPEQKRQLLAFVFSNLRLRGANLEYDLRKPFDLMTGTRGFEDWLGD